MTLIVDYKAKGEADALLQDFREHLKTLAKGGKLTVRLKAQIYVELQPEKQ